jgi:Mg/Co/Ni transporter MgtE
VDWLAHNLEVEGERADAPTVGRLMRHDVVRCAPTDTATAVLESIQGSPYPFAVLTSADGTVLGRVPASALKPPSETPVWDVAEPGPKTFRPHHSVENVTRHLAEKDLRWAIVTTPEGRLLGVASRADLERAGA